MLVSPSDKAELAAAWEVARDAFGDRDVPGTLIGVAALGYDRQLVEVEATAAVID